MNPTRIGRQSFNAPRKCDQFDEPHRDLDAGFHIPRAENDLLRVPFPCDRPPQAAMCVGPQLVRPGPQVEETKIALAIRNLVVPVRRPVTTHVRQFQANVFDGHAVLINDMSLDDRQRFESEPDVGAAAWLRSIVSQC